MYNVYVEVAPDPLALPGPALKPVPWRATLPAPANSAPVAALAYSEPVEFERERCYSVRAIRGGDRERSIDAHLLSRRGHLSAAAAAGAGRGGSRRRRSA